MPFRVTKILTDAQRTVETRDAEPTLEELQAAVGGCIERIPLPHQLTHEGDDESDRGTLWANGSGRIDELPLNEGATAYAAEWWLAFNPRQRLDLDRVQIFGPVVLVERVP